MNNLHTAHEHKATNVLGIETAVFSSMEKCYIGNIASKLHRSPENYQHVKLIVICSLLYIKIHLLDHYSFDS